MDKLYREDLLSISQATIRTGLKKIAENTLPSMSEWSSTRDYMRCLSTISPREAVVFEILGREQEKGHYFDRVAFYSY